MAIVKVSELQGAALDWAVAMAEKMPVTLYKGPGNTWVNYFGNDFDPSRSWDCCGQLFDKYCVEIDRLAGKVFATIRLCDERSIVCSSRESLIAICRAIVSAKLGDEIEVPDELIS